MFRPRFETLPPGQRKLWPELAEIPKHFVLYGGTGLALRLGHRESVDFDFFSSEKIEPFELLKNLPLLHKAKIMQNSSQTLTVSVGLYGNVKLSFFGDITLGRVGEPEQTDDGVLRVASLLDIAGTKAAVITQRAEAKDYVDMLAIINSGISLGLAMASAQALYGEQYNPMITVKSLTYFGDGDLYKLSQEQKSQLMRLASFEKFTFPSVRKLSASLSSVD